MLLELFEWLAKDIRSFNVFSYLTLRAVLAAATAMLIGLAAGPLVIRRLAALKIGQAVRAGRAAIASDQDRYADDGRCVDLDCDRRHDIVVGRLIESLHLGDADRHARLRDGSDGSTTTAKSCTAIRKA